MTHGATIRLNERVMPSLTVFLPFSHRDLPMLPNLTRRQWLLGSSSAILASTAWAAEGAPGSVQLEPNTAQTDFQVRLEVSMEGQIELPKSSGSADGKPHRVPLKANSTHEYQERVSRRDTHAVAARRVYLEAKSEGTVQRDKLTLALRSEANQIIARADSGRLVCHNDEFLLTTEEVELLRTPIVSFAVDRLLPTQSIKVGETWTVESPALCACLDLDSVEKSEVIAKLASIDSNLAKLEIAGSLKGSVNSVQTEISIAAKLQFDRTTKCVTWVAMSIKEHRAIGKAEPGFEIGCQFKMVRKPLDAKECTIKADAVDVAEAVNPERLLVDIRGGAGYSLLANRNWRLISDSSRLTVMRMIQQDQVVAQCEFRLLTPLKAGEQLTLEAFQADVRKALGKQFTAFLDAEEKANDTKVRILRTTVQGNVEDVPVTWCYLHFSDDTGKRIAATFTYETKHSEAFGAADAQIASSFQFYMPETTSLKSAQNTSKDAGKR